MAQEFCGTQRGDPPHVAVKIVHPDLAQDREVVARFLREAKLAAHLVHPNIVRIVSVGQDGDALYLVMELLFGDDLSAPIKQRGSFSEARAAQIVADVCDALQHAHDHGVVHRDIKPENVMLCRQPHAPLEEVVKVLDFGIAKVLDAKPDAALPLEAPTGVRSVLTRVGMLVGTPAYMSPEQGSARPIDHRSDIYSAGILLYELICGVPPFEGETPLQIVARHVHEQPRPPSQHTPVYPALEALILKMLEKDPNRRPPTAAAVAEALRGMQRDLSNVVGVALAPDERWLNRMARRATTNTAASSSRRGKRQEPTPLEPQPTLPSQPAPSASNGALAPPSTPTPRVATHPPSVPAPSRDAQPGGAATASSPVRPSADAIRLMKQTVPLRPGAPVASPSPPRRAPAEALRTAPMTAATPPSVTTGPASSSAAAPATLRSDSSPPSSAGSAVEKRLQARVDRLVRMLTILGAIVGVAFLVIIGLVVVLFLMR
jgi:serine/threonine-protein kinase